MISAALAKAIAAGVMVMCLTATATAALIGIRQMEAHWSVVTVLVICILGGLGIGVIRLILAAVENWIEQRTSTKDGA